MIYYTVIYVTIINNKYDYYSILYIILNIKAYNLVCINYVYIYLISVINVILRHIKYSIYIYYNITK